MVFAISTISSYLLLNEQFTNLPYLLEIELMNKNLAKASQLLDRNLEEKYFNMKATNLGEATVPEIDK